MRTTDLQSTGDALFLCCTKCVSRRNEDTYVLHVFYPLDILKPNT